jgi:hypothetical protein
MFAVIAYNAACDVTTNIRVYLQAYWLLFVSGIKTISNFETAARDHVTAKMYRFINTDRLASRVLMLVFGK